MKALNVLRLARCAAAALAVSAILSSFAECKVDFSIAEEKFPFVDKWIDQFSDELGEAVVFGKDPQFTLPDETSAKKDVKRGKAWELYRTAAKFFEANADFFSRGERVDDDGRLTAYPWRVRRMNGLPNLEGHPRIHHAVWKDAAGRKALFLANVSWADTDWMWEGHGRKFKERMTHRSFAMIPLWEMPHETDAISSAGGAKRIKVKPFSLGGPVYPNATWKFDSADWSAYDRLVIDVVSNGVGGDRLQLYVKDTWTQGKQADWILDSFTPGGFGVYRWVVPLVSHRRNSCVLRKVSELHIFLGKPENPDYTIASAKLLVRGAELPVALPVPAEVAEARVRHERESAEKRIRSMDGMLHAGAMRIGVATAMEKIRPDVPLARPLTFMDGKTAKMSIAGNEYEALQVIVGNAGNEVLKDVGISVSEIVRNDGGATFPATNVSVSVMGYVRTRGLPRYGVGYNVPTNSVAGYRRLVKRAEAGWYPDPVLSFLKKADVKPATMQSFWLQVKCPENQPAGEYSGKIRVSSACGKCAEIPFELTVRNFAIPKTSPMPLAIAFSPSPKGPCGGLVEKRLDEWTDFLADHFITIDALYPSGRPRWEQLLRLKRQGRLNRFHLSMWTDFKSSPEAERDWMESENHGRPRLDRAYATAKELGLLDHAYIYGLDEQPSSRFPAMKASLPHIKSRYPGVPVMSTCFDYTFGEDGMLSDLDVFIPDTMKYDFAKAEAARKNGRHVWWYLACLPHAPYANFFVECDGIEPRSLMGVQAIKYRPEGFLYYATSIWRDNKPVTEGPYTDWNPLSWGDAVDAYHGDGSWTVPGPDGIPLETVRLFNFRDGLEDYAYAKLLQERTGKWPEVSAEIVESVTNYNDSAEVHLRWREELAREIEAVKSPPAAEVKSAQSAGDECAERR